MAYQVLALKYRPKTFAEVVGQKAVVRTLENSLSGNRIHHAFLFSGVRGVGKTTVARLLAKALNCAQGPSAEPCNECISCREIAAAASLDVLEIDGASNNSVDDIRELRETVRYASSRDRYRIFIIDEVHMLSNSAFNALLKTLEEPPPHVIFVFATTEYRKIPVTILSRCQHFEFRKIASRDIANHLKGICDSEKVTISPYALGLISRLADGSLRDAQSTLDQVIAYSGTQVDDEDVRVILGVLDRDLVLDLIRKVSEKDAPGLIRLLDTVFESGHDPAKFVSDLMGQFRDLLLLKIVPNAVEQLEFAKDDAEAMAPLAERFSEPDLLRLIDVVAREESRIRFSPQPRYLLEALMIRLCYLGDLTPLEELLSQFPSGAEDATPRRPAPAQHRGSRKPVKKAQTPGQVSADPPSMSPVSASENSILAGPESASIPADSLASVVKTAGKPEARKVSPTTEFTSGEGTALVEAVLEKIHNQPGALGGFLSHAAFFEIKEEKFIISLPQDKSMLQPSIERREYLAIIRKAIEEVTGRRLSVQVEMVSPTLAAPENAVSPGDPDEASDGAEEGKKERLLEKANQSPVVQTFLDTFQAEITDIEEG